MDSIRIIQLPTKSAAGTDDYIAVDSTAYGTKKIQFPNLLDDGLTIQNKAADAKATGDAINSAISNEASARQATDVNLQTQIDQIIAPSGEAPSAAEVQNARIGAPPESTVYPTLGDAIRGQVSDLKSEINEISVKEYGVNRFDKTAIITGGYLKSDGTIDPNANWNTSGYCYVGDLEKVNFSKNGGLQSFAFLCLYDEGKNFISQVGSTVTSPYTITSGTKYIRFSFGSSFDINTLQVEGGETFTTYAPYHAPITTPIVDKTLTLHDVPADAYTVGRKTLNVADCFEWVYGKNRVDNNAFVSGYLNSSGGIESSDNWKTTDYCYVGDLENIVGSELNTGTNVRGAISLVFMCSYDEDKNFIEQVYGSGQYYSTWAVEEGVSYVRFCFGATGRTDIQLESGTTPTSYSPYSYKYMLKSDCYEGENNRMWANKKWTAVGDSLTEANSRTSKHYYEYVSDATGITVNVMGVSGTGYANRQDINQAFYQRISAVPTDSDVVTIFGSFNDLSSGLPIGTLTDSGTTTIAGCINKTIDNLQSVMPLVNLGIVAPTPWANSQPSTSGDAYNYVEMLKAICEHRSIPFLDLWRCSNLRPWDADFRALAYSHDDGGGTHPDETGHMIIAPRFKAFLESLLM